MHSSLPLHRQRSAAWQQACTHRRRIHVARAKRQGTGKPRGSDPLAGIEWWKDDSQPSTSTSTSQSDRRQPQRGPAGGGQQRGRRRAAGSSSDEEEVGWWERPRGAPGGRQRPGAGRFQYQEEAEEELSPWQEEQLKVAYAMGRRKMKVLDLAADLGLDRVQVLDWVKAFAALGEEERAATLAPLEPAIAAAKQKAAAATAAAQRSAEQERQRAAAAALAAGAVAPDAQAAAAPAVDEAAAAGRAAGAAQLAGVQRRLSGEALRSLAGVYRRSPWPPREVVAGLWELHRLPREAVLAWFRARRAADGLPDNPRDMKAGGGMAAASAAASGDSPSWLDADSLDALISNARVRGVASGVGPGTAKRGPPAELQQMLSGRELTALRSALPSPRTYKGAKIRQELGIKDVEEVASGSATTTNSSSSSTGSGLSPAASGVEAPVRIAGITFVVRDSGAAWALKWRRWRLAQGTPASRLDFQRWLMRHKQQNRGAA